MDNLLEQARGLFEGVVGIIHGDLATVKTGRAKPELVENVMVEAYPGTRLTVKELATISAPDPHQLIIKPWDQNILGALEKGLAISEIGLNPVVDGDMVRIIIPMLTEERRKDLVLLVHKKLEAGKNLLRRERQEMKNKVEAQKGQPNVSEDDIFRQVENLDKLTSEFMDKIDGLGKKKEQELMQI